MKDPHKDGFTKVPNFLIPRLAELTHDEIIFWLYLRSRCFAKDHCWPSYKTIMIDLGLKYKSQVKGRTRGLVEKKWLKVVRGGTTSSNRYFPYTPGEYHQHVTMRAESARPSSNAPFRPEMVALSPDLEWVASARPEEEKLRRKSEIENAKKELEMIRPLRLERTVDYIKRVAKAVKKTLPYLTPPEKFNSKVKEHVHKTTSGDYDIKANEFDFDLKVISEFELFPWADDL